MERYPVTFTSKLLCELFYNLDQQVAKIEHDKSQAEMNAAYWERQYHILKNKEVKPGWVMGSAIEDELWSVPDLDEVTENNGVPF